MADWIRNSPTSEFMAYAEKVKNEVAGEGPKPWQKSFLNPGEPVRSEDLSTQDQAQPEPSELLLADRLLFDGHTLSWISEKDGKEKTKRKWPANSGNPVKGYEPIPPGTYYSTPQKDKEKRKPIVSWGPFPYRLHEGPLTRVRNRLNGRDAGFFIHGGYAPGTAGCIEFKDYAPEQKSLREFDEMMRRYGKKIRLDVEYK